MNPELLRNLWLEFSLRRLIAMPLVLAILFAAPLIRDQPRHAVPQHPITLFESPFPDADTSLVVNASPPMSALIAPGGGIALGGAIFGVAIAVLLFLWGTRLAADSLFSEVSGRTWDSQRSSAIGAWAMTVGKLFGATAYVWYGALFCLAVWAYLQPFNASTVLSVVIAGLWTQALALFVALLLLRMAPDRTRFRVTLAQSVVLPVAMLLTIGLGGAGVSRWYALAIPSEWFVPASLLLAAGWTIAGIYQLMRAELQLSAQPIAWAGFLVTLALYFGGFAFRPGIVVSVGQGSPFMAALVRSLLLAAIVITMLAPVSALLSPPQLLPLRRFLSRGAFKPSGWVDAPSWALPVGFAAILLAAAAILGILGAGTPIVGGILDGSAMLTAMLLLLFAVRDIGILHMMSLNPNARRGVMATIVIMALSYIALPLLAAAVHARDILPAFRPDILAPAASSIAIAVVEIAIIWALAARTYRHFARPLSIALLAGLVLAPSAKAARWTDDPCPRTSAHEMLIEAGIVFEGRLLSQGPPPECAHVPTMCGQEIFTFQADRVLKGNAAPGSTINARRLETTGRPLSASDPRLSVPPSGLYVLIGQASGPVPEGAIYRPAGYMIDECLLGLPQDMSAEAEAYAAQRDALKTAAEAAPNDAEAVGALADHLLRHRDAAARRVLEQAVVVFPASQAIRARYLHVIDPTAMLADNRFQWQQLSQAMPEVVLQVLETPATPEPASIWVQRFAIAIRKRPAEADSPLRTLNDFSAYTFSGLQFAEASLPGAKFEDACIQSSDFRGSDLSGADLRWAEFDRVDLSYARLADADLRDWNPATRSGGLLLHRYRPKTNMIMAGPFGPATPESLIKLLRATLDRARMDRAMLVGADLRQASLKQASLRDADLRQSDLRGADLTGADLTGAALDEARFDCRTKWPDTFTPAAKPDPASDTAFCSQSLIVRE